MLGQLTSGIVHEFSQPLAAIRSNSYLASQYLSKQQPEQALEKLDRIDRITDRATKLCQHLKSFARKTDDVTQRTYVYKAVINAIDLFTESLPEDWVTIDIATDLCVRANEIRLEQVLVNAISNSLDAIQQRLGDDEFHPSISISANQSTDWINLCITDNGCGMNQEQIDQIFEPFFTTKEVGSGLGLGMSITHNIIQDFGGTIFVQSEMNKGTEVMVCLKPM